MSTHVEVLSSLVIGTVEAVSPDSIVVLLELDAPHTTALNTGTPSAFPRLNGYVLIPNESGATVAYISWIGIERSPYPKRFGLKDFGLIDLPFPLRKMSVSPVGTLTTKRDRLSGATTYDLSRGVTAFPSVGDQVLVPSSQQVEAIVGAGSNGRRVHIGSSPLSSNAKIVVDPNKMFGRHLAVLGNTGSGKSCTVAGLIRWSLEAAKNTIAESDKAKTPNARFIVLDPNGEYAKAFEDQGSNLRVFRVPPVTNPERPLDVPAWLWSGHEWTAVAHAQPGAQRPLLLQGLRELKSGRIEGVPREAILRRYLISYSTRLTSRLSGGTQEFAGTPGKRFECARFLQAIASDCSRFAGELDDPLSQRFTNIADSIASVLASRLSNNPAYYNDFLIGDLETVRTTIDSLSTELPDLDGLVNVSEDAPLFFDVNMLAAHLEQSAVEQGGNLAAFTSTLGLRIRGMLADPRLGAVIGRDPPTSFDSWLNDYVGGNNADNGQITVIDLSLVPSELVHIIVSVLARLIFESLQRYRRSSKEGRSLPTVLVLEEAHAFIRRGTEDDSQVSSPARLCREIFERIAREGRKFGLGLVLSSQRPAELSPTVLAQCNTFLLHRIVNDADQNLVAKLVPDNVSGLLRELPSLPSRQAILLGWATPIPILIDINELPEKQRPWSADPDFWEVWSGEQERPVNWKSISDTWSQT